MSILRIRQVLELVDIDVMSLGVFFLEGHGEVVRLVCIACASSVGRFATVTSVVIQ